MFILIICPHCSDKAFHQFIEAKPRKDTGDIVIIYRCIRCNKLFK